MTGAPPGRGRGPAVPVLMLLVGISPLATDMYLAALPAMQTSLHTSAATIQLTLTGFLVGLALGQFMIGPISDGIGRRPFLIGGSAAFLLLSLVCAFAPNGPVLVAARIAQGFASAAGIVCGKAVISDHFPAERADRRFALVVSAGLVSPVVAPAIGGLVLSVTTWRGIFAVLAVIGAVMLVGTALRVPETLPPARRHPTGARASLARVAQLLGRRVYRRYVVTSCLAVAGFFTYIGGSSFVLQRAYGITETTYTVVFASNALAMVASSGVLSALVERIGAARLQLTGLYVTVAASVFLLFTAVTGLDTFTSTWVALCGVTAGMGLVLPASIALTQRVGADLAGTASALLGGLQFLCGAVVTPLTGLIGYGTVGPMAAVIAFFMVAALVSATVGGVRSARTSPEPVTSVRAPGTW